MIETKHRTEEWRESWADELDAIVSCLREKLPLVYVTPQMLRDLATELEQPTEVERLRALASRALEAYGRVPSGGGDAHLYVELKAEAKELGL